MIPLRIIALIPSLGRTNEHEVVAAARAIGTLLKVAGLDWHDIARACGSTKASTTSFTTASRAQAFGDVARACRDLDQGRLSVRERVFVADMVRRGFGFRPSPRQEQWLADIFDRLQAGRAAA